MGRDSSPRWLLFGFKGLHQYYPTFPDVITDMSLNDFFTQPPANQMGFFHIYLSLAAIGFFYLLPTDLLFSLWFFFLVAKSKRSARRASAMRPRPCRCTGARRS